MSKIYVVVCKGGEYPNEWTYPCRGFTNLKKAERYMAEMEANEEVERAITNTCIKCTKPSANCPFFIKGDYFDSDCDNRDNYLYRDEEVFYIEEVEYEE